MLFLSRVDYGSPSPLVCRDIDVGVVFHFSWSYVGESGIGLGHILNLEGFFLLAKMEKS